MPDTISITVLPDGTIKTDNGKISMPNHAGAEAFMRECARLAGGAVAIKHKHGAHTHSHSHETEHHHH